MIYGTIEELGRYKGVHSNLDKAIEYIQTHDLKLLPLGRTVVDADNVYINVMDANLIKEDAGIYESHRRYLDLHVDIEGSEKLLICDYSEGNITKEYSTADDYELMTGNKTCECSLDNAHFAICMLMEPHKPCVSDAEGKIHKAVFKILFD